MFNRTLQVDVVKKKDKVQTSDDNNEADFEAKVTLVTAAVGMGIKKIGWIVCSYVVLDTVRKFVVESIKQ